MKRVARSFVSQQAAIASIYRTPLTRTSTTTTTTITSTSISTSPIPTIRIRPLHLHHTQQERPRPQPSKHHLPAHTSRTMSSANEHVPKGADKLVPADHSSTQVIRKVTANITTVSAPFARFGLFKVGSRATIVKLANDSLAVFSPSALTPEVRQAADELGGNVSYLVAPDYEHHIFLTQWAKAYPSAKVIGVEGLPEKRASDPAHGGVPFTTVYTAAARTPSVDAAFDAEFNVEYVPAHGNKELVVCHRPSRTLIQADLMFNLPAYEQYSATDGGRDTATQGIATRLWNSLMHARGGHNRAQQRFLWHAIVNDRSDFSESIKRIDAWDWDRMIPCHGDVIETGAKPIFEGIMTWHLNGKKA